MKGVLGRGRRRAARAVVWAALGVLVTGAVVLAEGDDDPLTDLPFVGGEYRVTCGWHADCSDAPRRGNGIDLAMPVGELVIAAGDGAVQASGWSRAGYGNHVRLSHDDGWTSTYAHLSNYFPPQSIPACRLIALGYSGVSGTVTGPHLHFEANRGRFTPIFGRRSLGEQYLDAAFDPELGTPPNQRRVHHDCGPRGGLDCRDLTRAMTVDETQSPMEPRLCQSCPWKEFGLTPWGGGEWEHRDGGFGYGGQDEAKYFEAPLERDGVGSHWAWWMPRLGHVDPAWRVYVFIPQTKHRLVETAQYYVRYYEDAQGQRSAVRYYELPLRKLSESAVTANGWYPLTTDTFPTHWANSQERDQRPLTVAVNNRRVGDCAAPNSCAGRYVAADAVMFVPSQCAPAQ